MIRIWAILLLLLTATPALARLSSTEVGQVGVRSRPDAQFPTQAAFRDQQGHTVTLADILSGRPAVLVFADYRCNSVCGPAFAIAAAALGGLGLKPGRDYRLIAIGLRPGEPIAAARAFETAHLNAAPEVVRAAQFLTGDAGAIQAATDAVGYRYAYDRDSDQFVHPVAAFVLTPDGRLARAFPEVAIAGPDLGQALTEARQGRGSSLIEIVRVLCHGLDPTTGIYNGAVQTGLRIGALGTLIALAAGIGIAVRRRRSAA